MLDTCAFLEHLGCLRAISTNHAIANEAIAHTRDNRCLLDLLGNLHDGQKHIVRSLCTPNYLEQLHDVCRAEEVSADHILRTFGKARNLVQIQRRCVRSQNGSRFADAVEFLEYGFLDIHVLEYSLNHEVFMSQVFVTERGLEQCSQGLGLFWFHLALRNALSKVVGDVFSTPIQRLLLGLQQCYRNARQQEVDGDAAAHGACANDSDAGNGPRLCFRRNPFDLRSFAFGQKQMSQSL